MVAGTTADGTAVGAAHAFSSVVLPIMAVAAATSGGWFRPRGDHAGGWSIAATERETIEEPGRVMRPRSFFYRTRPDFIQILLNRHAVDKIGNNIARHDLIWCEITDRN
jgi:hypothetical protein